MATRRKKRRTLQHATRRDKATTTTTRSAIEAETQAVTRTCAEIDCADEPWVSLTMDGLYEPERPPTPRQLELMAEFDGIAISYHADCHFTLRLFACWLHVDDVALTGRDWLFGRFDVVDDRRGAYSDEGAYSEITEADFIESGYCRTANGGWTKGHGYGDDDCIEGDTCRGRRRQRTA